MKKPKKKPRTKRKTLKRKQYIRTKNREFFERREVKKLNFEPKILNLSTEKVSKVSINFGGTILCVDGKYKGLKGYVIEKRKSIHAKMDEYKVFFPEVKKGLVLCERQQLRRIKFTFL